MRFHIANSRDAMLAHLLSLGGSFAAVEAEWGDAEIGLEHGALVAYNHHGPRAGRMCPSLAYNSLNPSLVQNVALSHIDHDALLGCMALMGRKPDGHDGFYALAAYADVSGPHRINVAQNPSWGEADKLALESLWAWLEAQPLYAPRDGTVQDCTGYVEKATRVMEQILAGDRELLEAGARWAYDRLDLNVKSLKGTLEKGGTAVLLRQSDQFVNHLYDTDGKVAVGVVGYNTVTGEITVSVADPDVHKPFSCDSFVKSLWGREAGGHVGIAGSPRGRKMDGAEWHRAGVALLEALILPIPAVPIPAETEATT